MRMGFFFANKGMYEKIFFLPALFDLCFAYMVRPFGKPSAHHERYTALEHAPFSQPYAAVNF